MAQQLGARGNHAQVATLVDPPRVVPYELAPLTPEEARAFLAHVRGDRLEALYLAAIATGLRQGELFGLRWSDVDLFADTLTVRHTLQRIDGKPELVEPKTTRSRRTLRLPVSVAGALRAHRVRQLDERAAAGPAWEGDRWDLVFTNTIGGPLDSRNVTQRFQRTLAAAGLRRLRFHDLRHSAATLLLLQGVPARVAMEILGHSQISTTMNVYAHVLPALMDDAASRMDAVLTGPEPAPAIESTDAVSPELLQLTLH